MSSLPSAGHLGVAWHFCEPADPEAKGAVERLPGLHPRPRSSRAAASLTHLDFQDRLDRWFRDRANARFHRGHPCRSRRAAPSEELEAMRALPEAGCPARPSAG